MDSSDRVNKFRPIQEMLSSVAAVLHRPRIGPNGRFDNPWTTWVNIKMWTLFKYIFCTKSNANIPSTTKLDETLPVIHVEPHTVSSPPSEGMRVTWLGHATVLVQFDGISVLTDPVFSERVSPFSFLGPKRYRPLPVRMQDLPPNLDAVVISHNHYDHLDHKTVLSLNDKYGSKLQWFVPKGVEHWMRECGCESVTEMSWWEVTPYHNFSFVFTPAQHWGRRGLLDRNKTLWGSWCIVGPVHRFYFAGDTGYCEVFKQIGEYLGPFDLAAIPIGAYEPRWMMRAQHVEPKESIKIHQDIRATRSLGIHWGTFVLTKEFYLEPPQRIKDEGEAVGLQPDEFFVLKHGESRLLTSTNEK